MLDLTNMDDHFLCQYDFCSEIFYQGDFLACSPSLCFYLNIKPIDFTHDIPALNTTCRKGSGLKNNKRPYSPHKSNVLSTYL